MPTLASLAGVTVGLEKSVNAQIITGVSVSKAASAADMQSSSSSSKLSVTPGNATAPRSAITGSVTSSVFSMYFAIVISFFFPCGHKPCPQFSSIYIISLYYIILFLILLYFFYILCVL